MSKKVPFKIGEKVIGTATFGYFPDGIAMNAEVDADLLTEAEYDFLFKPELHGYSIGPINTDVDIHDEGEDLDNRSKLTGIDYLMTPITELSTHFDYSSKAMTTILAVAQMNTEELEKLAEQLLEGK